MVIKNDGIAAALSGSQRDHRDRRQPAHVAVREATTGPMRGI